MAKRIKDTPVKDAEVVKALKKDKYKVVVPFTVGSGKNAKNYKKNDAIELTKKGAFQFLKTNKIK